MLNKNPRSEIFWIWKAGYWKKYKKSHYTHFNIKFPAGHESGEKNLKTFGKTGKLIKLKALSKTDIGGIAFSEVTWLVRFFLNGICIKRNIFNNTIIVRIHYKKYIYIYVLIFEIILCIIFLFLSHLNWLNVKIAES